MPGKRAVLALIMAAFCMVPSAQQPAEGVRLLFTGDILLSRQVSAEIQQRKDSPWTDFTKLFHDANLVGGNFESAIGDKTECLSGNSLCFAAQESSAALMKAAGFSLVTAENNHSGDLGKAGRDSTSATFQSSGIPAVNFDHSPQFFRVGRITLAVVAITLVKATDGEVQQIPSVTLTQKMRLARQLANVVLVSIHWGNELQDWPADTQQQQARWLVAHGADLIVGHHPHVIQPPQCVDGKPVFFSLGNHLFDQKYGETKDGLIADCHIHGGQLSCGGLQTHTDANTSYPTLLGRDAAADSVLQGCTTPISAGLQVKGITIKPVPWSRDQPEVGVVLEGYRGDKLQWRSRRQELVSLQASSTMGTEPLLVSLERHPSSIDNELGLRPYVYAVGPGGLVARWRGSALAWPLLDAITTSDGVVCALHRDDSFLLADPETKGTRIAAYRWNGFGFTGVNTPVECAQNLLATPN